MFPSVLVYGLFALTLMVLGIVSSKREKVYCFKGKRIPFLTWDVVLAILLFAFISGIRWRVGTDHIGYLYNYENLKQGVESIYGQTDYGFIFLSQLLASLNLHFFFYFALLALIPFSLVYYSFKRERYLYPYLGLLIVLGPEYLTWMNVMRQAISASMFVFAIQFISQRKFISYLFIILLASLFHKSAILLLFFYFIPQKDYFRNRYVNIALVLLTLVIGFSPSFMRGIAFVETVLGAIGYNRYAENFTTMLEYSREVSIGPRSLIILFANLLNVWYAPKMKKIFSETNYLIYFNYSFVGILMFNLLVNTSHIFLRPVIYFTIFLPITTAYLLYYFKPSKPFSVTLPFLIVLIISISYTFLSVIADYEKGDMDFSTFKFFWGPIL